VDVAPAHKAMRLNHFMILGALLRNFFGKPPSTLSRFDEDGQPTGPFRFGAWTKPKKAKTKGSFRHANETFRWRVVSHWNPYGRRIAHFAVFFVFNGLTPF
jgi:hypothetical protein